MHGFLFSFETNHAGNAPLKVEFSLILPPHKTPVSINWDFGDGDVDYSENPTHIFQSPGAYIVTLTTRFQNGTIRESIKRITVAPSW